MKKHNNKIKSLCLLLFIVCNTNSFAYKGDLNVIVKRPGKNELFVSGEFKTLFVLNNITGKTIRTFLTPNGADRLAFTKDGTSLLAAYSNKLMYLDPETGDVKKTITGSDFFVFNEEDYIVDVNTYGNKISVYSSADGTLLFNYSCTFSPNFVCLNTNKKELYVFSNEQKLPGDSTLVTSKSTASTKYNTFNSNYITQQNDGKAVNYFTISLTDQKVSGTKIIPYSPSAGSFGSAFNFYKNQLFLLSYDSFYKINPSGKITPIEFDESGYSFSATKSIDGKYIIQAGNKKGFIYNCETEKFIPFEFGNLFDSPTSIDICINKDTVYMISKDYSIDIFTTKAFIIKKTFINFEQNKGKFAVLYYNGKAKKEDRDKEALIINTELKKMNLPVIDLEIVIGKDDVLLTTFNTVEEANSFKKKLSDASLNYITIIIPFES